LMTMLSFFFRESTSITTILFLSRNASSVTGRLVLGLRFQVAREPRLRAAVRQ
jgi:hypothetical protein